MGSGEESLAFGGQALIEGIMIRSRSHLVMCVRQPNGGILTQSEAIDPDSRRSRVLGLPFIRGVVALFETTYLGAKGISFSANVALEEEEEDFTWKEWAIVITLTLAISSIFFVVPFVLTNLLHLTGAQFNIVEALIRLALFLAYMAGVSLWGEFRRVLQYHGAEHKAINALEAGEELTVENVREYPRLHRRCGTSFIFIVILVSIALFSLLPGGSYLTRLGYRIALMPLIGSVSYEVLRFSARHADSPIIRLLTTPGLLFQRLTTREPDDEMIEVAIKAVEETLRLSSHSGDAQ